MERNWLGGREEGMKERTRWDEEGRKGKVKEKRGPVVNVSYLLAYMLPDQTERTNHKCAAWRVASDVSGCSCASSTSPFPTLISPIHDPTQYPFA